MLGWVLPAALVVAGGKSFASRHVAIREWKVKISEVKKLLPLDMQAQVGVTRLLARNVLGGGNGRKIEARIVKISFFRLSAFQRNMCIYIAVEAWMSGLVVIMSIFLSSDETS